MICKPKRKFSLLVFLTLILSPLTLTAADPEKGKALYQKNCISCHGEKGEGNPTEEAPRLSKQHDWYVLKQLKDFKAQVRSNPKMYPFIKDLSEADFADLAAYIAQL